MILLTCLSLTLAGLAGCHLCHKKQLAAECCTGYTSCGCEDSVAAPIAAPAGVVVSGPSKILPGPVVSGIPGPPGR
jgi:hypothetical protein